MLRRPHSIVALFASAILLASGSARAQESDIDRARAEFVAGTRCVDTGAYPCAVSHFRAALELHDAASIRYNLASALFELGKYPEAARLAAALSEARSTPDELREHGEALVRQIAERGAVLEIVLSGRSVDAVVRVDGDVVPGTQLAAVPVRAGAHHVVVTCGARHCGRSALNVEAGARRTVELPLGSAGAADPAEAASLAALDEPEDPRGRLGRRRALEVQTPEPEVSVPLERDWRLWFAVGVVAAILTGVGIGASVAIATAGP